MEDGGVVLRDIVIMNGTAFWTRQRETFGADEELKQQRQGLGAFLGSRVYSSWSGLEESSLSLNYIQLNITDPSEDAIF